MSRTPTPQQVSCIAAAVDAAIDMLKIEACAGAGKTSTLTMMAEALPAPSLYLAFNKVTATEGAEKFPKHVTCKTTHSVAYAAYGAKLQKADKLSRPRGKYVNVAGTGAEVGRFFSISPIEQGGEVVITSAFMGLLVKVTVQLFEQSADMEMGIQHTPYGMLMEKAKTATFNVANAQQTVLHYAKKLWKERTSLNSIVLATHDTYLKMYQLSKPVLGGYEVLYVDEFQDTTPCVLDIVMNQKGRMKIVMVGDARQAIYGWRGAVNAMKMVNCQSRSLTKSFRYGQAVADIATTVLEGAMQITGNENIKSVVGFEGKVNKSKPYTRLFRTNAALLGAAITELRRGTEVSIEIDVKDFVKLLQSAVALSGGKLKEVKHDKVLPYTEWHELLEEAKNDGELARIAKVVGEGQAEQWIETLDIHVNSSEPHVTFTTAHKSKGREFSQVIVESDFKSAVDKETGEWKGLSEEEQNLLYVACTRAIDVLEYNSTVLEYLKTEGKIKREFAKLVDSSIYILKRDVSEAIAA